MLGECKFCGQTMIVEDAVEQQEADKYATMHCECQEGRKFRNIEDMKEAAYANAEALFKIDDEVPFPDDALIARNKQLLELMKNAINAVAAGVIEKATIKIGERTTASIFITATDGIRIKKNYKEEYVLEANRY